MPDILTQLREREKTIHDLQQKKARLDGQREQLLKQLKSESGVETIDKATEKLEEIKKGIEENEARLIRLREKMDTVIKQAENKQ
jgi:predicted mannosyl-3-phosphoglycerate phosphatase (HAD superfamily)